jgi:hypothetical protein
MGKFHCILMMFLFNAHVSNAQSKTKTIVIDTLKLMTLKEYDNDITFFIRHGNKNQMGYNGIKYTYNKNSHPNLICKIDSFGKEDVVRISIDKNGGYLELISAYYIKSDTIFIDRMDELITNFRDTIFIRKEYYKKIKNDTGIETKFIKSKSWIIVDKIDKKFFRPEYVNYRINSKFYSSRLEITPDSLTTITWYHGYKPRRRNKNGELKKRTIYLAWEYIKIPKYQIVTINLNPE